MKKIIFLLLSVIIGLSSYAQLPGSKEIHITVKDENNIPVHSARVLLLSTDSLILKTTTTDKSGTVLFKNLDAEKYNVQITHIGFESFYLPVIEFKNEQVVKQDIILKQTVATLKDVVVTAKKAIRTVCPR